MIKNFDLPTFYGACKEFLSKAHIDEQSYVNYLQSIYYENECYLLLGESPPYSLGLHTVDGLTFPIQRINNTPDRGAIYTALGDIGDIDMAEKWYDFFEDNPKYLKDLNLTVTSNRPEICIDLTGYTSFDSYMKSNSQVSRKYKQGVKNGYVLNTERYEPFYPLPFITEELEPLLESNLYHFTQSTKKPDGLLRNSIAEWVDILSYSFQSALYSITTVHHEGVLVGVAAAAQHYRNCEKLGKSYWLQSYVRRDGFYEKNPLTGILIAEMIKNTFEVESKYNKLNLSINTLPYKRDIWKGVPSMARGLE
jgi:hypothetical protein